MEDSSIAISVKGCLELFRALALLQSPPLVLIGSYQTTLMAIADEESRFKVWSGNIGAHASGRRSLHFRLRDASHLQKHVLALLTDLSSLLENALAIMKGEKVPWDQDEDEDDDISDGEPDSLEDDSGDDELPRTEMEQIAYSVSDCVNCLLRLSATLRNPAPHDRFAASVPIDVSHYESFDIKHVQDKFQKIDGILAQRLGNAISKRRQYFKYRESHHLKLAHGLDPKDQADGKSTIASSIPGHAKRTDFDSTLHAINEDALSDAGISQTSFASSLADTENLRIPPLPKNAESGPFECPFCFMIITATNRVSWRRHVFADLRPYVCLSEDCTAAENWFARRHEWILHEIENHWKSYVCPYSCSETFQSRSKCIEHVYTNHPSNTPEHQVKAMINLGSRSIRTEDGIFCPICQERLESMKRYQIHVGRHQEQLAIFALPTTYSQDDDDDLDDDDEGLDHDEHDLDNYEDDENDLGDDEIYKSSLDVSARISLGSSAAEEELHNEGTENTDRNMRYDKEDTKEAVQSQESSAISQDRLAFVPGNVGIRDADDESQYVDDEEMQVLRRRLYLQQQQLAQAQEKLVQDLEVAKQMFHKNWQLIAQHDNDGEGITDPELHLFNGQSQQVDPGHSSSNYFFSDESDRPYTHNPDAMMEAYQKNLGEWLKESEASLTKMEEAESQSQQRLEAEIRKDAEDATRIERELELVKLSIEENERGNEGKKVHIPTDANQAQETDMGRPYDHAPYEHAPYDQSLAADDY